jgi:thiol:disulfide interchange protein DsbG
MSWRYKAACAVVAVAGAAGFGVWLQQRAPSAPIDALASTESIAAPNPVLLTRAQQRARAETLLQRLSGAARIVEVFSSPTGLTGVVLDGGQGRFIAWMPDGHDVLIVGAVFDRDGANATLSETIARGLAEAPTEAGAATTATPTEAPRAAPAVSWRALERAAGFDEGAAGPRIVVFVDPLCSYCAELWRRLRAPLANGRLRVRWVPVGVIAPESAARAAALLRSPQPSARLGAHDRLPVPPADAAAAESIAANNALLALVTAGRVATPVLAARDARGAPQFVVGLPADLEAWLPRAR